MDGLLLVTSIEKYSVSEVKYILENRDHYEDNFTDTIIFFAVRKDPSRIFQDKNNVFAKDHIEIIKLLIENGFPVNCEGIDQGILVTALAVAVERENIEVVKLLLEAGADPKQVMYVAIFTAFSIDNLEIFKILLESTTLTLVELSRILVHVVSENKCRFLNYLFEYNYETRLAAGPALETLTRRNNLPIIQYLVEVQSVNVNCGKNSSLLIAISIKSNNIIKYLIEHGAKVEILADTNIDELFGGLDVGICALVYEKIKATKVEIKLSVKKLFIGATQNQNIPVLKYFLEEVQKKNSDLIQPALTASLRTAIAKKNLELVKLIVESGANINYCNGFYLQYALDCNQTDIAVYLMKKNIFISYDVMNLYDDKIDEIKRNHLYEIINRKTDGTCLINLCEIPIGDEYYLCPNNPEHIYSKKDMDQWKKKSMKPIICFLCNTPLNKDIYINVNKID